jgi:hypothetical protein
MPVVIISPSNVVTFPEGGGHFWVYMQYVQGLRRLGCEVYWLEQFQSSGDPQQDAQMLSIFYKRMATFGLSEKAMLYSVESSGLNHGSRYQFISMAPSKAKAIVQQADLLLNFFYSIEPSLLLCFRRTALVDIDPGLLQFWISVGQLVVPPHDYYFTTGETVGTPDAEFSDCDLPWIRIRPPLSLELWPYSYVPDSQAFTTISGWWGNGGKGEWITDGQTVFYENNKRVSFMEFVELPCLTPQLIELALCLGKGDREEEQTRTEKKQLNKKVENVTNYKGDAEDQTILERYGWKIRHAYEVAGSPEAYQAYIQRSRGEFSCAKPSCMKFQNAWISDRTLCYLASGKPVVVQQTGTSSILPNGEGMFRFSTLSEAVDAFAIINANYEKHCRAARAIVETYFDAKAILEQVLNSALGSCWQS